MAEHTQIKRISKLKKKQNLYIFFFIQRKSDDMFKITTI